MAEDNNTSNTNNDESNEKPKLILQTSVTDRICETFSLVESPKISSGNETTLKKVK